MAHSGASPSKKATHAKHADERAPLLGIETHPSQAEIPRIPTFMQDSIPNRRSILGIFWSLTVSMAIELIIPIALYYAVRPFTTALVALVISGFPPAVVVVFHWLRDGIIDMQAIMMVMVVVLSSLLAMVQSDPRLFLLRESAITLGMGSLFLITLIPFTFRGKYLYPFLYYTARQFVIATVSDPHKVKDDWKWIYDNRPRFRLTFRVITGAAGIGLVSEFVVRVTLLMYMDVDDVIYYSNIYLIVLMSFLGTFILGFVLYMRHRSNRERLLKRDEDARRVIEQINALVQHESSAHEALLK
ncbi:hypothetical protein K450DRAFT_251595 [Umbelopsis ramanniana AG]|uniref:Transmembrane protein n=1 Tax=Umbelopsis ramanniana AG TaxID=1314678 RepID=A0AAD5E7C5_UMBRA|nr:uncharacterized protein K450DRAFT_251595 [Umbelopsis ramanniana AG]KAI8577601.1 hypothetical protein K450DRAFT_251595 [Umbelopsis ramanniana AG]